DHDRILRGDHGAIAQTRDEQPVEVDDASGVAWIDGRHLDDLAVDQLEPLFGPEDAGLSHLVILVHREQSPWTVRLHRHRHLLLGPVVAVAGMQRSFATASRSGSPRKDTREGEARSLQPSPGATRTWTLVGRVADTCNQ